MRVPSLKTLRAAFPEHAAELRRLLKANRAELKQTAAGAARVAECFHAPKTADIRLHAMNAAGAFFGVETIETVSGEHAEYLNAGDSYSETVIRWRGNYRVQSVGDFIETMERRGIRFR